MVDGWAVYGGGGADGGGGGAKEAADLAARSRRGGERQPYAHYGVLFLMYGCALFVHCRASALQCIATQCRLEHEIMKLLHTGAVLLCLRVRKGRL